MLDPKYHDQHAAGVYRAIALRFYCRYVEMRPARWPAFSIQRCALRAGGFARRAKCDFRYRVSSPVRAAYIEIAAIQTDAIKATSPTRKAQSATKSCHSL